MWTSFRGWMGAGDGAGQLSPLSPLGLAWKLYRLGLPAGVGGKRAPVSGHPRPSTVLASQQLSLEVSIQSIFPGPPGPLVQEGAPAQPPRAPFPSPLLGTKEA